MEDTNFDNFQRGLISKAKVFNNYPQGVQGFAFNTRQRALGRYSRSQGYGACFWIGSFIIQKLFYNEYSADNSYFPGTRRTKIRIIRRIYYDPEQAAEAAGRGRLERPRLAGPADEKWPAAANRVALRRPSNREPHLTIYQEDLRKVGITLNLRLVTFETHFKLIEQRQFDMVDDRLGRRLRLSRPET